MSVKPFENFEKYKKILDQLVLKKQCTVCGPDKFVFDFISAPLITLYKEGVRGSVAVSTM